MAPSCTICQTLLGVSSERPPAALPCGHVFHEECVKEWFIKSALTCPACRAKTSQKKLVRLFLDMQEFDEDRSHQQLDQLETENIDQRKRLAMYNKEMSDLTRSLAQLRKENRNLTSELKNMKIAMIRAGELEAQVKSFEKIQSERDRLRRLLEASHLYASVLESHHSERDLEHLIENGQVKDPELYRMMRTQHLHMKQNHEQAIKTLREENDEMRRSMRNTNSELIRLKKQKSIRSDREDAAHLQPRSSAAPVLSRSPVTSALDQSVLILSPDENTDTSMSMSFLNTPGPSTSGMRSRSLRRVVQHTPSAAIKTHQESLIGKMYRNDARVNFSFSDIPQKKAVLKETKPEPFASDVVVNDSHRSMARSTFNGMTNRFSRHASLLDNERAKKSEPPRKKMRQGVIMLS